ncbi:hypothetical protein [Serratia sarumanii]|uniref:hypothetical protein n=1 Tax=Serratia sarumanii TaxID=3020826 RepID=UPI003F6CB7F0
MTLTTERLKWLHDAATELSATKLKMTMRPDELLVLTSELLANREAQPVAWTVGGFATHDKNGLRGEAQRIIFFLSRFTATR